jgi:hypothetical protein
MVMRKKWDEQTKLQLGRLIRNQLDMHVKLNDAVDRAAEILQAPRSTCMNYWQKELKDLDYSQPILSLKSRRKDSQAAQVVQVNDREEERARADAYEMMLNRLSERLMASEERFRELYQQTSALYNEHLSLTRELSAMLARRDAAAAAQQSPQPIRAGGTLEISELAVGDIVCIHHHIWHDNYYITSIDQDTVNGYKLNKNLRIRRKSKEKMIPPDLLVYGKIIRRDVKMEDIASD